MKKDENSKAEMILGDETNLNDLRFVSKDEIENIKIYPNIKEQIKQLLDEKEIVPYLGLLWDK